MPVASFASRAHDGAEDERGSERQRRVEKVGGETDADRGEEDQPDGEDGDRPQVAHELGPRHPPAGVEEERRQEDLQDEVGRQLHARKPGQDGEAQPTERQERRIGQPQAPRQRREHDDRQQETEDEKEPLREHAASLAPKPGAVSADVVGADPSSV